MLGLNEIGVLETHRWVKFEVHFLPLLGDLVCLPGLDAEPGADARLLARSIH